MWFDMFRIVNQHHRSYLTIRGNQNDEDTLILVDENSNDFQENFVEYVWQFDQCNVNLKNMKNNNRIIIKDFVLKNVFTDKVISLDSQDEIQVLKSNSEIQKQKIILNVDFIFTENKMIRNFERIDYQKVE